MLGALSYMSASSQSIYPAEVERWRALVLEVFPEDEVHDVLSVMECESYGDPSVRYMEEWGQESVGLLQINEGWLTGWGDEEWAVRGHDGQSVNLEDPSTNLRAAAFIRHYERVNEKDDWSQWACQP